MKHATGAALDQLEPFLIEIRQRETLREKNRGVFYRKSKAFLHFHQDPDGLFADVRLDARWERVRVTTRREQHALLRRIDQAIR